MSKVKICDKCKEVEEYQHDELIWTCSCSNRKSHSFDEALRLASDKVKFENKVTASLSDIMRESKDEE